MSSVPESPLFRCISRGTFTLILALLSLAFCQPAESAVAKTDSMAALSEELFLQPFHSDVSPGLNAQAIEQAPAAISVISAAEIRASGAATIPELLQWVPGIDLMVLSASHVEINARGLNSVPADKMLVLIDGRSVYRDYSGAVNWSALPVVMDQIERIEVVRSPGSALYGANAFSGVINIITRSPAGIGGLSVFQRVGELHQYQTSIVTGNRLGRTGYRVAAGYDRMNGYEVSHDRAQSIFRSNFMVERTFGADTRLSFDAGLSDSKVNRIFLVDKAEQHSTDGYLKFNAAAAGLGAQLFWNRGNQDQSTYQLIDRDEAVRFNALDLDIQKVFSHTMRNSVVSGVQFRYYDISSNILDSSHSQSIWGLYFHDEYRPVPELSLLAGIRVDHHPLSDFNLSPRLNMIYSPLKGHVFRLTANRAYRNPSFLNSYLRYFTRQGIRLQGNPDLKPEGMVSLEAGYTWTPSGMLKIKCDLFHLTIDNHISFSEKFEIDNGVFVQPYRNFGTARGHGGELSVDFLPNQNVKLSANYSYQKIRNRFTARQAQHAPRHKGNLKLFLTAPGRFSFFAAAGYVGSSAWETPAGLGLTDILPIDDFMRVAARLALLVNDNGLEIFFAGNELIGPAVREYPLGEPIQRRLSAGFHFGM